jgi:hypothetical protein
MLLMSTNGDVELPNGRVRGANSECKTHTSPTAAPQLIRVTFQGISSVDISAAAHFGSRPGSIQRMS